MTVILCRVGMYWACSTTTTIPHSSAGPRMGRTTALRFGGMFRVCLVIYLLTVVSASTHEEESSSGQLQREMLYLFERKIKAAIEFFEITRDTFEFEQIFDCENLDNSGICEDCHRLKRSVDLNEAHSLSTEYRLPLHVIPTHYTLDLEPYTEDGVYTGRVRINITILDEIQEILLHCDHAVHVSNAALLAGENISTLEEVNIENWTYDSRKPILTVRLNDSVPKDYVATLDLKFNSTMESRTSTAFFMNFYVNEKAVDDSQSWPVAGFQLRPTNARRVFPCFDQPALKTTFDFSVVQPKNTRVFGNTIAIKEEEILDEPNAQRVYFKRTPPISTFALGLAIANLTQCNETIRYSNDKLNRADIRVWAPEKLFLALRTLNEKLERVFHELDMYWGVPLPMTSLDIIALPQYRGAKPADSFGLIIFRENELANIKHLTLAQEIGYQWVGILSTPAWWSELHLNKAIISYVAADIAFKINNGDDAEGKWPMTMLYSLYYEFSKRYPHSKITGMKQETAAVKIELILRMLNYTLGPDVIKKSMQAFMNDTQLKTFTADKLWSTINEVNAKDGHAKIDVKAVIKSWIGKDRLPFITATRNDQNNDLHVTQNVFLRELPKNVADADRMLWWIPIAISRQQDLPTGEDEIVVTGTGTVWMEPKREMTIPNMPNRDKFIIINAEDMGPFLVNYDTENWDVLAKFLQNKQNFKRIPVMTRAKLIHDSWNLAFAGELSFKTALDMTLFLRHERHHLVWEPFFTLVDRLSRRICPCIQHLLNRYVQNITNELWNSFGPKKDWVMYYDTPMWFVRLREEVNLFLCRSDYPPCSKQSIYYFNVWTTRPQTMHTPSPFITDRELMTIGNDFVCPALEHGTLEIYQRGLHRLLTHAWEKKSDRTFLLKALAGCPRDITKISTLLNVTVMNRHENISETDQHLIFSAAANTVTGTEALFAYLRANFDALRAKFVKNTNLWDNIINSATLLLTTDENLNILQEFYKSHKGEFSSADHIIERNIKIVREEVIWTNKNMPVIQDWLNKHVDMSVTFGSDE